MFRNRIFRGSCGLAWAAAIAAIAFLACVTASPATARADIAGADSWEPDNTMETAVQIGLEARNLKTFTTKFVPPYTPDVDWRWWLTQSACTYELVFTPEDAQGDPNTLSGRIEIYSSTGVLLTTASGGAGQSVSVSWKATERGRLYARVLPGPTGESGPYSLTLHCSDQYEPDNTLAQAHLVPNVPRSYEYHTSPGADQDWYKFWVWEGFKYGFGEMGGVNEFRPKVRLYDAAGTTELLQGRYFYTAESNGWRYLCVEASQNDGWAKIYQWDPYNDSTPDLAVPISTGGWNQYRSIDEADEDWVYFDAIAGWTYDMQTNEWGAGGINTIIELYASDGRTLIASDDDSGEGTLSSLTYVPSQDSRVYLRVDGKAGEQGEYRLTVTGRDGYEPDDTSAVAKRIPADGSYQNHGLSPAGDVDWLCVDVRAGYEYSIQTEQWGSTSPADTELSLYDSNKTTLISRSSGTASRWSAITYTATADKRVYLKVKDDPSDGYDGNTGAYRINVTERFVPIAPAPVSYDELAGVSRYDTAIDVSKATYPTAGSCDAVILATGRNFPDALGAGALAGVRDCPILLVDGMGATLSAAVRDEIKRLTQGRGTFDVYLMGGTLAISSDVESSLKAQLTGENVIRVAGTTRYDTAIDCAKKVRDRAGTARTDAFLVTGGNYADALLAGPVAFAHGRPILLTDNSVAVNDKVKATLTYCGTNNVAVIGSPASITETTRLSVDSHVAGACTRVAGATDCYQQSVNVANWATGAGLLDWSAIGVATGEKYPDALGASSYLGTAGTPLLLTHIGALDTCVRDCVTAHKAAIGGVTYFGGTLAVSQDVRDAIETALQ